MSKVFIANLPDKARGPDVEDLFMPYGKLKEICLKTGYGVVEFDDERDAEDAVRELNGKRLMGEKVTIAMARDFISIAYGDVDDRDRICDDDRIAILIGKYNEERKKLQEENKSLEKSMKDDHREMMGKILELEENNEKLKKEVKRKKSSKDSQKSSDQIKKLKDEILKSRKENHEESINLMQKIESLKKRLKSQESKLEQNETDERKNLQKAAKVKENILQKSEIHQLKESKERDNQQIEKVNKKNFELELKLNELKSELERKKHAAATQELTFRVIQERLVYTTNEAEKFKQLAQNQRKQLSSFCSSFLRQSSEEFEMENDFEKSMDVLNAEEKVNDLQSQLKNLESENQTLANRLDEMVTCSICDEKFESGGDRIPTKLKCSHIFCHKCAAGWLKTHGKKASCPQCRTIYQAADIKPINFNAAI